MLTIICSPNLIENLGLNLKLHVVHGCPYLVDVLALLSQSFLHSSAKATQVHLQLLVTYALAQPLLGGYLVLLQERLSPNEVSDSTGHLTF